MGPLLFENAFLQASAEWQSRQIATYNVLYHALNLEAAQIGARRDHPRPGPVGLLSGRIAFAHPLLVTILEVGDATMQTSTQDTGNYVRPTPKEIAFIVKELRRHFELKQLSLAADAGVTERTIERIEAEIPVSADTLRRVAGALKLREGAFTDPRYCPSQADVMTEVEKIRKERTVTDLQDLSDARDLENIMGQDGHLIDGSAVESSLAEALAVLKDQVQDWGDIFGDIPNVEKLLACQQVLASIREIEGHGYTARWGRYITDDKCSVGVLVFFKTAGPQNPRRAIVPRW